MTESMGCAKRGTHSLVRVIPHVERSRTESAAEELVSDADLGPGRLPCRQLEGGLRTPLLSGPPRGDGLTYGEHPELRVEKDDVDRKPHEQVWIEAVPGKSIPSSGARVERPRSPLRRVQGRLATEHLRQAMRPSSARIVITSTSTYSASAHPAPPNRPPSAGERIP